MDTQPVQSRMAYQAVSSGQVARWHKWTQWQLDSCHSGTTHLKQKKRQRENTGGEKAAYSPTGRNVANVYGGFGTLWGWNASVVTLDDPNIWSNSWLD